MGATEDEAMRRFAAAAHHEPHPRHSLTTRRAGVIDQPPQGAAWPIHSPKAGASAAGTAPTQTMRVPGSSARKLRGTAGSGAATIVPGAAS